MNNFDLKKYSNYDDFVYGETNITLAPAASSTIIIQIEADAAFLATKFVYFASIAGGAITESTRVIPLVTLQINDTGSSRNLFNKPIPLDCVGGNGQRPFMFPIKRLFNGNSTINLTFANFSAVTTYRLDVAFVGEKRW